MISEALRGVRVVSLAEQYPGPLATFLLAELGADVIQVERPGRGDPQRLLNPELHRAAGLNKRSVALDLKSEDGLKDMLALVQTADVLVEGYRPGVMARLGLAYEDLQPGHPKLIYCSISGYGQSGPNREVTGHNINYEALVGGLDPFTGAGSMPYNEAALPFGDIMAGMTAALGIVSAVLQAVKTGEGAYLDISIADSLLLALAPQMIRAVSGAEVWTSREAAWGVFSCSDGDLALGIAFEDEFWKEFCLEIGLDEFAELSHEARVERKFELRELISRSLRQDSVESWMQRLAVRGVPCSPARTLLQAAESADIKARDMFVTAKDAQGKEHFALRSPLTRGTKTKYWIAELGEHTQEVLEELHRG